MKKPMTPILDLTALDRTASEPPVKQQAVAAEVLGRPLQIPVKDIEEDPAQPRHEFPVESMEELERSIRLHGVKTPVSIRPHPTQQKRWILNFGARRLRASIAAGKTTIPAFIDRSHTDYQQVIENLQREELKPRELAMFIKKKMDDGEKQAQIAELLGVNRSMVTNHLALIDPPNCIDEIYATGKCTSAKTLYDLRNLHKEFPKDVERWCSKSQDITRATVSALGVKLKAPAVPKAESVKVEQGSQVSTGESAIQVQNEQGTGEGTNGTTVAAVPTVAVPSVFVVYNQRSGTIDLRTPPTQSHHVIVNFTDGGHQEVPARDCIIDQIVF